MTQMIGRTQTNGAADYGNVHAFQPFDSSQRYLLHFGPGQTPPAEAFRSLTMYDGRQLFTADAINRFAIGDRDALTFNGNGSLDIPIRRESPGADVESKPSPSAAQHPKRQRHLFHPWRVRLVVPSSGIIALQTGPTVQPHLMRPTPREGETMNYPLLNVFWTIFEVFLWVAWFWILITVFIDIFRSSDLSGWGKALWFLFVLVIPLIGVLVYLIARGGKMHERAVNQAQRQDEAFRSYVQETAGTSPADQLAKLAELRDQGAITDEEFAREKAKVLA